MTKWTDKEISILDNLYEDVGATGVEDKLPQRTRAAIRRKANRLGLRYVYRIPTDERSDICVFGSCNKPTEARNWCRKHYSRWFRHGDPSVVKKPPGGPSGWEQPTTQKAQKTPTVSEISWAAGFLEGEGYFHSNGSGCEGVTAAQVKQEPLKKLLTLFGGTINEYEPRQDNWQTQYKWEVYGSRARGVMMTLYPIMSAHKQKQIRDSLDS